jgi:hypothetical protein
MVKNLAQILNVNMNKNIFSVIFLIIKLIIVTLIFTKVSYSNEEKWDLNKFNENIKWNCISGNCIDGFGVATYSDPQGRSIKYSGSWKDAKRHGKGVQERNHYVGYGVVGFNQKAEGEWENDIANGSSKIIFSNGLTYYQEHIKGKIIGERVITPDFEYIGEPIDLKFNDRISTIYAYLLKNCEAQGFKGNWNPITFREKVDTVWYFFSRNNSKHEIVHYFGTTNSKKENFFYGEGKFLKDKDRAKGVVQNSDKDKTIRLYDKIGILRNMEDDTILDYRCK